MNVSDLELDSAIASLYGKSSDLRDQELYSLALDLGVELTGSQVGFFHLISEDQENIILYTWNKTAMASCTAGVPGTHYPLASAGNWVDCVREKRVVIYNDFPNSPNQKGLPAGHFPLKRFMSVPVIENGKVRIIFGVGNKSEDYKKSDGVKLQLIANELHKIVNMRRVNQQLEEHKNHLEQQVIERTKALNQELSERKRVEDEIRVVNQKLEDGQRGLLNLLDDLNVEITKRKRAQSEIVRQLDELQRWQEVTLDREDRIRELKQEVNRLCEQHGESIRYQSQVEASRFPADSEVNP